jgi:hypothetical protein
MFIMMLLKDFISIAWISFLFVFVGIHVSVFNVSIILKHTSWIVVLESSCFVITPLYFKRGRCVCWSSRNELTPDHNRNKQFTVKDIVA